MGKKATAGKKTKPTAGSAPGANAPAPVNGGGKPGRGAASGAAPLSGTRPAPGASPAPAATTAPAPPTGTTGPCWAYLVRCADNSLYAGWTNDLEKRLAAHNAGTGARYTRGRRPVRLAFCRPFGTKSLALKEEARLKRLPKAEKERLATQWAAAVK